MLLGHNHNLRHALSKGVPLQREARPVRPRFRGWDSPAPGVEAWDVEGMVKLMKHPDGDEPERGHVEPTGQHGCTHMLAPGCKLCGELPPIVLHKQSATIVRWKPAGVGLGF